MSDCRVPMPTYKAPVEITGDCPFCGSADLKVKPVWKTYRFVACGKCKAGGPVCKTEEEAIVAFNKRAGNGGCGGSVAKVAHQRIFEFAC